MRKTSFTHPLLVYLHFLRMHHDYFFQRWFESSVTCNLSDQLYSSKSIFFMLNMKRIPEFLDCGRKSWMLDSGRWTLDAGHWSVDSGRLPLNAGLWTLDAGLWMLDSGLWTLDSGR